MYKELKFIPAGDNSLVVEVGNDIQKEINLMVRSLVLALERENPAGLKEILPTYRSLLIYYDPFRTTFQEMKKRILDIKDRLKQMELPSPRLVYIPTLYGGEFGPDLEFVSRYNALILKDVIKIHSSTLYMVYMLGFTPGFCYLGGMSEKIATPRLDNPRLKVPAGSVGITGTQTGIYPVDSPGGWRIIGQTPIRIYNPYASDPFPLRVGDYLKFYPINFKKFKKIKNEVEQGHFGLQIKEVGKRCHI